MMLTPRLAAYGMLLMMPAIGICVAGGYILRDRVPKLESAAKARQTRELKMVAEEIVSGERKATYEGMRKDDWRMPGRLRSGLKWGSEPSQDGGRFVYVESGDGSVRAVTVTPEESSDSVFELRFAVYAGCVTSILMSLVGVWLFVGFAKARDDFLAAAAHDLTSPLAGMRYLLGEGDAAALRQVERMIRLVDNIRDFLRLGGKRPSPKLVRTDAVRLAHEAYGTFEGDYADEVSGPVSFTGESVLAVMADETLTVQIMWNLFGNDLKYAAPHGKVEVNFSREGGKAVVEFRDEGPGMTPRQRARVFDRYYRTGGAKRSGKGGFGIGLCNAREFARAMGGELRVSAVRGCVFRLELPCAEGGGVI